MLNLCQRLCQMLSFSHFLPFLLLVFSMSFKLVSHDFQRLSEKLAAALYLACLSYGSLVFGSCLDGGTLPSSFSFSSSSSSSTFYFWEDRDEDEFEASSSCSFISLSLAIRPICESRLFKSLLPPKVAVPFITSFNFALAPPTLELPGACYRKVGVAM